MVTINKRSGEKQAFDSTKLMDKIVKAMSGANQLDIQYAKSIVEKIRADISSKEYIKWIELNDSVEQLLASGGFVESAKHFLLYRINKLCAEKTGEVDFELDPRDLSFSYNSIKVMERRHLNRDSVGIIRETPVMMFRRIAKAISSVEGSYGKSDEFVKDTEDKFFHSMITRDFVPNTPALANAGLPLGQLSACFVLPVGDSLEEIFDSAKHAAIIHKTGGGTGFSFSRLRPNGGVVKSTGGIASGPVSFMKIFDTATDVIKQGGRRRGANMGVLRIDHPDVDEFINSKDPENTIFSNFNISVAVTDTFMDAVENDSTYDLINPKSRDVVKTRSAKEVFENITKHAWLTGDPGMLFIDRVNRMNPVSHIADIESTNPCGEQPLMPYESCNLGTINLGNMVTENPDGTVVDWNKLRYTARLGTRFLDNVVDANNYPIPEIEDVSKKTRKIGLGMMGFADLLIHVGIKYDSEKGIRMGEKVANFVAYWSHYESIKLANEKGAFPAFRGSRYEEGLFPIELEGKMAENIPELGVNWDLLREKVVNGTRNSTNTTVAPNGLTGVVANAVSSIEPAFAIAFRRVGFEGISLLESHPLFEKKLKEYGVYSEEIMREAAETGSITHLDLPAKIKDIFRTSHDISPEWHVRAQAAFQRYVDSAVSKTINLHHNATTDDITKAYTLAYELGCKGITVYRDQSKVAQVIHFGLKDKSKVSEVGQKTAEKAIEIANLSIQPSDQPKSIVTEKLEGDNKVDPLLEVNLKKSQVTVDAEFSGGCDSCDL
ncbi:MAG: adenosylcobalamin-dependent ribonucleoside-diphosphate reductase [Candidatus Altiarchaeota archaeon]|nr:adenosylcobalamin-dependent ribonucleoside-diphosphate reductase [Candidatus Altiarchaeota archaeon]